MGEEFIRVFEEIASKSGAEYLIQGTIYPDRIESGASKNSDKIKSHHNVAGLTRKNQIQKNPRTTPRPLQRRSPKSRPHARITQRTR